MNGIEQMIESEGEQGWSNFVKTGKTGPKNVDDHEYQVWQEHVAGKTLNRYLLDMQSYARAVRSIPLGVGD